MRLSIHLDHILSAAKETGDSLPSVLRAVRERGFSAVDVTDAARDEDIATAREAGLSVAAMRGYYHLGYRDEDAYKAKAAVERASSLDASYFCIAPGILLDKKDASALERIYGRTEEVAKHGKAHGVTVVIENLAVANAPYVTSGDVRRFLEKAPSVALSFNSGNFSFADEEAILAYRELSPLIRRITLKDGLLDDRTYGEAATVTLDGRHYFPAPVGCGDLHIRELYNAIKKDGYDGDVVCEHFGASQSLCIEKDAAFFKAD